MNIRKLRFVFCLMLGLSLWGVLILKSSYVLQDQKYSYALKQFLNIENHHFSVRKSVELWHKLAKANHMQSQCILGALYRYGYSLENYDIEPDKEKSEYFFKKARENGCRYAQNYEQGDVSLIEAIIIVSSEID